MLEFEFPDTGEGVTEGTFLEWLVEEGEEVDEDQTVAEVETDKAVVDVPAPKSGTVNALKAEPGDTVKVGEVIMILETGDGETGKEEADEEEESVADEPETDEAGDEPPAEPEEETVEENGKEEPETTGAPDSDVLALPKARKLAEEKGVDIGKVSGSGPEGRVTEEDVRAAAGEGSAEKEQPEPDPEEEAMEEASEQETPGTPEDVDATPSTRKLAREKGVDLAEIEGSGRGGKITRDDVLEASGSGQEKRDRSPATSTSEQTEKEEVERIKMSGVRKAVADKMEESRLNVPHVTHVEKADVTNLVDLRERLKDKVEPHLTYLPFIMEAVRSAMENHPRLNAELDAENEEIVLKNYYDFNIAVDTERGLMVPLVEEVGEKSIVELASSIEEKVEKTRNGDIRADEMRPGTFSITNQGVIGGEEFTPIINPPQVAILGVGRISETAEVVDGEVTPRHTVKLSLSYDHRVIDGADAARFMNEVVENLENPEEMLIEL
ncbi:MAG: 2-oxo acid dehydrogenase subunit E2 [Candidatus Nanohaloarchaea archaeon]